MNVELERTPPLRNGDHLDADEFLRRYHAMPGVNKAELIDGVVYMPSPVSAEDHGDPHADLIGWMVIYRINTPGVRVSDNATARLSTADVSQPDGSMRIVAGGRTRMTDGYIVGGPELAVEVAASSVSIDRNAKWRSYRAAGVLEYILWRTEDRAIDWFVLEAGAYVSLPPGADGVLRSRVFPGLWLDAAAMVAGDMVRVEAVLRLGLATPEHAAFVARLRAATP